MNVTIDWLKKEKACEEAVLWASSRLNGGKPLQECIEAMERADWLIWLLWHTETVNIRQLVWLACLCGKLSLRFVPAEEKRPKLAIEAAEAWAKNPFKSTEAIARDAARAAISAAALASGYAAEDAAWAASDAAKAAGDATENAAWAAISAAALAAEAAAAAGDAAEDAAWAAGDAAKAAEDATENAAWAAISAAALAAEDAARAAEHRKMCTLIRTELKEPNFMVLTWPAKQ